MSMIDVVDIVDKVAFDVFICDNIDSSYKSELCHIKDGKEIEAFHVESSSMEVKMSWHHDAIGSN